MSIDTIEESERESPGFLLVNEIFGPTIQGEGPHNGQHCLFVRLANCNLTCKWCDTAYTWAFTKVKADKHKSGMLYRKEDEIHRMHPAQVLDRLSELWDLPTNIVFSGGEPLLQRTNLVHIARPLRARGNRIHIETAGTLSPRDLAPYVDTFVVSPKLANSGNAEGKRLVWTVLKEFASWYRPKTYFKFVLTSPLDIMEVDEIVLNLDFPANRVFIMPEGTKPLQIIEGGRKLIDTVLAHGYNLSLRTHTLLWSDERAH